MKTATSSGGALVSDLLLEAVCEIAELVLGAEQCLRIVLFGSRASGWTTDRSDIDLGIDAGHPLDAVTMQILREAFDELPILQQIDIVDFARASEDFREIALADTVVLFEREAA